MPISWYLTTILICLSIGIYVLIVYKYRIKSWLREHVFCDTAIKEVLDSLKHYPRDWTMDGGLRIKHKIFGVYITCIDNSVYFASLIRADVPITKRERKRIEIAVRKWKRTRMMYENIVVQQDTRDNNHE